MGEEAGATSPFLFFTDFHDELADAVREGRRREFKDFAAFASQDARARIPDPNARETFDMSRIVEGPDAAEWLRFYQALLTLRHRAIVPGIAGAHALEATVLTQSAVQAVWRLGDGRLLSILLNLGDLPVDVFMQEEPAFAAGTPGGPASCAVWIDLP